MDTPQTTTPQTDTPQRNTLRTDAQFFTYGEREVAYLKARDKKLAAVIERIGHIHRRVNPDLFADLIRSIVGQQISTVAQRTIWQRTIDKFGAITPEALAGAELTELQSLGISFRKAEYILGIATAVATGELDLAELAELSDAEVIEKLSALRGVGVWTAEMIMLFSMQRPDIFSFGDLAILRGIRMVYRHKAVDRQRFERYRKRFSPYGSVASLYLWEVAGGAIPELTDPAARKTRHR